MPRWQKIVLSAAAVLVVTVGGAVLAGSRPSIGECVGTLPTAQADGTSRFSAWRTRAADGNCLQAYEWAPAAAPVRGALVVVHGLHDHARRYDGLAAALNAQGVAVIAQDHRGHAGSGGARQRLDSVAQLVGDVDLALQEAAKRHPSVPLFLYGHSLGGMVAAHAAAGHAARAARSAPALAGVVLSSAALAFPPGVTSTTAKVLGLVASVAPELGTELIDESQLTRDTAQRGVLAADPLIHRGKLPARTVATLLAGIGEIQQRMPQLEAPLLLLHGKADAVTPPEGSRQLAERAGSRDKQLELYEGLRHDLLHEPEAAQVAARIGTAIGGWLAKKS